MDCLDFSSPRSRAVGLDDCKPGRRMASRFVDNLLDNLEKSSKIRAGRWPPPMPRNCVNFHLIHLIQWVEIFH